jgi:hypothetical protein
VRGRRQVVVRARGVSSQKTAFITVTVLRASHFTSRYFCIDETIDLPEHLRRGLYLPEYVAVQSNESQLAVSRDRDVSPPFQGSKFSLLAVCFMLSSVEMVAAYFSETSLNFQPNTGIMSQKIRS